ncbi:MAG: FixH family protein [Hyphomicrobiaceae bacterium]
MSPTTLPRRQVDGVLTGRHVLAIVVGFFALILAVNIVLLYQAISTNSGLVAQEPYRKGLDYNSRIKESDLQSKLGWQSRVDAAMTGAVTFAVRDRDAKPVSGLAVAAELGRPASARQDHAFTLKETEPGLYVAQLSPLGAGNWVLKIDAWDGEAARRRAPGETPTPTYRLKRRLWLKP